METALFVSNVILDSLLALIFLGIVFVFVLEIKYAPTLHEKPYKKACKKDCPKRRKK